MGLNIKEQQLIDLLTITNQKLDTIITQLGGVPPSGQYTIDDLWQVMSDIHLDTQSIDQKLLAIRNAIIPQAGDIDPHYPMQTALTRFYNSWLSWLATNDVDWVAVMGTPQSTTDNVLEWLSGIGHVTGDATTTILGRLTAIENYSKCACGPIAPTPDDPDGCADQYVSVRLATSAAYDGRSFAGFAPPVPPPATFTDVFDIGLPYTEISVPSTPIPWRVFGYSQSASVYMHNPLNVTQYPTNQWIPLANEDLITLAFSVDPGNDLVVYLCPQAGPPFADCVTRASEIMTVTYPVGVTPPSHTRYYTPLDNLGLDLVTQVTSGGQTFTFNVPDSGTSSDMIGVSVELLSGPFARVIWINTSGGSFTQGLTTIGQQFTVPEHTTFFAVDNWQTNDISPAAPYTVELCPAGPA